MPNRLYNPAEEVKGYNFDQSATVLAGGFEAVNIEPPEGKIWEVMQLYLTVGAPSGATTGEHHFDIQTGGLLAGTGVLYLESSYADPLAWRYNYFYSATNTKYPPTDQHAYQVLRNYVLSPRQNFRIVYVNNTDADQTGVRSITFIVKEKNL